MPLMPSRRKLFEVKKFFGFESYGQFQRFWHSLKASHRLHFLSALGFTFATIGFVIDLSRFPVYRSFPRVLLAAAAVGLISVALAFLALKGTPTIPLMFIILAGGMLLISRLSPPKQEWILPTMQEELRRRLVFDSAGMLFCTLLGYSLFVTFIGNEGVKQLRILTEVSLARDLHNALVPAIETRVGGLEILGKSMPSSEVGGDLLDVWADGETVSVYIADVSGHGVNAGAMMGMAKSAIRVQLATGASLDRLIENLNDVLVDLTPSNMFMTLTSIRFRGDRTEICSAGHLPILWYSKASDKMERIHSQQIPVGFLKKTEYSCSLVNRSKGDLFVLLTDGITEVRNSEGEMFGLERVEAVIGGMRDAPLGAIFEALMSVVRSFGAADDDQTMMLVRT